MSRNWMEPYRIKHNGEVLKAKEHSTQQDEYLGNSLDDDDL